MDVKCSFCGDAVALDASVSRMLDGVEYYFCRVKCLADSDESRVVAPKGKK